MLFSNEKFKSNLQHNDKYIIWEKSNLDVQESIKMYFIKKKMLSTYVI